MKTEAEIMQEVEQVLRRYLADVPFLQVLAVLEPTDRSSDLLAKLRTPAGDVTLILEIKTNGQPRIARETVVQLERLVRDIPNSYGVFVAPYISPNTAEICIQQNIGYMDFAGNCRLNFWPVYIKTTSEQNPFTRTRTARSLFSSNSTQTTAILRVLLANPKRVWRTQELATEAGTSLGQVANVKKQLEDREWACSTAAGLQLTDPIVLLTGWSENYDMKKWNGSSNYYSLKSVPEIEAELAEYCNKEGIEYALTGFSGGARYAPAVRYQSVAAYVSDDSINKVATALNLKEVTSGANVTLISFKEENVLYGSQQIDGMCVASPPQVYLDLKSLHARGEEAAEALLKGGIEPKWQ